MGACLAGAGAGRRAAHRLDGRGTAPPGATGTGGTVTGAPRPGNGRATGRGSTPVRRGGKRWPGSHGSRRAISPSIQRLRPEYGTVDPRRGRNNCWHVGDRPRVGRRFGRLGSGVDGSSEGAGAG